MPRSLSTSDPHLVAATRRLRRMQQVWGLLLLGLGVLTELLAAGRHPVAGLPFIAVGLFALRWAEPALLATVSAVMAFSIVPTINPRIAILGPDPLTLFYTLSTVELGALVLAKVIITLTAANQFFFYRLLYGTERATTDEPDLPIIPAMVPNRTNGLARSARWLSVAGLAFAAVGLLALTVRLDPSSDLPRTLAEMGGSLAVLAAGLGLGTAFSPTDERPAALTGFGLGLVTYLMATAALLQAA